MKYIALIDHGPNWLPGKTLHEQGLSVKQHLVAMRHRYDEGTLLLGGPFADRGGLAMLDVPDEAAARAIMDADPAVIAGVMTYEIKKLHVYFDTRNQTRS